MSAQQLKRTPFHDIHVSLNAKMVPFAGFEMPVQYPDGSTKEHEAVRSDVGVFDVSHMGEIEITGPDRNAFANRLTCNDVGALVPGQAQYSAFLSDNGTFIDDCVLYRFDDRILIVVNAANKEKVWEHILAKRSGIQARVKDASDAMGLLAVQGPNAEELLASLGADVATSLRYYYFAPSSVAGTNVIVSRTGYTGEDGFEIFCRPEQAEVLWHALVGKGRGTPCGLAARDSLRLEMGYPLYGNDIDETVNPYEVRLGWIVKLDKGAPFNGLTALQRIKARGVERKLVGFRCADKGAIPRPGYEVFLGDRKVDIVRSGGFSPSLGVGIGTTLLPSHSTDPGTEIEIDSRGKKLKGEVVALPFYQDGTAKKS